jgi:hypothetical protein
LLSSRGQAVEFDAVVASLPEELRNDDPLYGTFGRLFYPTVFGSRLVDHSFTLAAPGGERVVVECDVLDGTLGRFGMPIRLISTCTDAGTRRNLLRSAVKMLCGVAVTASTDAMVIAEPGSGPLLSDVGLACLAAGGAMRARIRAVADLSCSPEELRADVRKSVKSLLNWGVRSLELRYCNAANPDRTICDAYQQLHRRVAGRVTSTQDAWNVMFNAVQQGRGELVMSYLEGELVGGLVVVDSSQSAYYASGAFARERPDLPLSHWPLMDAILRAKQRGMLWFDLGEILFAGEATGKEESVGYFKKAFTSRVEVRAEWRFSGELLRSRAHPRDA